MKFSLAIASLSLFGVSVVFLVLFTLFESALLGMSPEAERVISLSGLFLPGVIGAVLGVMSLLRRERHGLLAVAGTVLNTLFALFHLMVILFAG